MLEILVLIGLTNHIGKTIEAKGHKSAKYKWMTVGLWFGGEIVGAFIGTLITGGDDSGRCLLYIIALSGAAVGAAIANSIANNLEPLPGSFKPPELSEEPGSAQELLTGAAELERHRVEKLGVEVAICPNCQTPNSLSLLNCTKCHTNIEKVKPVRNPYL